MYSFPPQFPRVEEEGLVQERDELEVPPVGVRDDGARRLGHQGLELEGEGAELDKEGDSHQATKAKEALKSKWIGNTGTQMF